MQTGIKGMWCLNRQKPLELMKSYLIFKQQYYNKSKNFNIFKIQ